MSYHEGYDPELIKEIEDYLRVQKEDQDTIRIDRNQAIGRIKEFITRGHDLEAFISQEALIHDVQTAVVPYEQRTVKSEELVALANNTINGLFSIEVNRNDRNFSLTWTPRGREELSATLMNTAIPPFLSADYIIFESYRANRVEDLPPAPKALGIIGTVESYSRLRIGSPAGALTDSQTRTVMEHVLAEFPDAVEHGYLDETSYYFFRDQMGKSIYLPTRLLGPRALQPEEGEESEPSLQALSNITAGDLALAKIGLLAVQRAVLPQAA